MPRIQVSTARMVLAPRWRCPSRPSVNQLSSLLSRTRVAPQQHGVAAFGTSAALSMPMPAKKKTGQNRQAPARKGQKAFSLKKKKQVARNIATAPKPGERKQMRNRIVLSNTTALEVEMQPISEENIRTSESIGSVLALPDELIDRLRASAAFRRTQAWQYFRRPAMLIRKETVELANEMKSIGKKHIGRVLVGERGTGKSLMLLQAQAIGFQQGWTVINIPEAQYITDGSADYRAVPTVRPMIYDQRGLVMALQRRVAESNPQLGKIKLAFKHALPIPIKADGSILDLLQVGARDHESTIVFFQAVMKELTAPGRPPVLITLDGLAHIMKETAYRSPQFQPIHAHDLTFVRWFMSHLSGEQTLPNGGLVLAATSASNEPNIKSLRFRLHQLEVKQALEKGLPSPRLDAELPDPILPFLLATGQQPNPVPQPEAHGNYDQRVFHVLGSPYGVVAGNKTADTKEVQVQAIKGMSKEEARGMMEYWAKSGVMRQTIDDKVIGEKWSLSGGGVPGELERTCVKFRI